ncbi:MAG TPA: CoA transferase, partial [Terrimesophilobacter sp.]|nr:CoA transferase [Terrimesophilobacter sp.]
MPAHDSDRSKGFLNGIRVLELADELGEYCGKVLAGLGADVIKVEPPGGESTRAIGPFLDDIPNVNRSLHFWHYNFGKRSVIVDPETEDGQRDLRLLITSADVVIDTRHRSYLEALDLGWNVLHELNPELIYARISPFGDDGPWADYVASDLVHLALGGVMMNCGYDPTPDGRYDTPPIAPQMWQSYHIAGEQTAIAIVAALVHRLDAAIGQRISTSVHQAVSANTETDVPDWIYSRHEHFRQTCRHSLPQISAAAISRTKDGRWLLPYRTYLPDATIKTSHGSLVNVLANHGLAADLGDHPYFDPSYVARPEINLRIKAAIDELVGKFPFDADI